MDLQSFVDNDDDDVEEDRNGTKSAISRKAQCNEVLSSLCDKIKSLNSILNGHIRRIFKLKNLVIVKNELNSKGEMIEIVEFLPKK